MVNIRGAVGPPSIKHQTSKCPDTFFLCQKFGVTWRIREEKCCQNGKQNSKDLRSFFLATQLKNFLFEERSSSWGIIIAPMDGGEMITEVTHTFNDKDPGPTLLN